MGMMHRQGATVRDAMDDILRGFMRRLERGGYVREWRPEFAGHDDTFRLTAILHTGQDRHWAISRSEMTMGGTGELSRWLDTVEDDIRAMVPEPVRTVRYEASWTEANTRNIPYLMYGWDLAYDAADPATKKKSKEADQKSKDLFILACGQAAFDTMQSGKPLPITGSSGTKYTLHKRASYCVERDGAKLCAVVPGVPLWDHLLGVKLMVEHDEERFLKTANVARSEPISGRRFDRIWFDEVQQVVRTSVINDADTWVV